MARRPPPPEQSIRAVIFDLDGVLVDSEPMHYRASNRLMRRFGKSIPPDHYREYVGMGETETLTDWRLHYGLPVTLAELRRDLDEARLQEIAAGIEPIDAAVALARALHRDGMRLALASASTRSVIDALLAGLGLTEEFALRVSGEDAEVARSKPAPDIYLRAVDLLGVDPSQCVAIEDSQPGIRAAKAAGLFCVAVPSEWTSHQDFGAADVVMESLRYFRALLEMEA